MFSFFVCIFPSQDRYKETVQECTKALELNPSYIKALFRRAEAHEKLENYDEAIAGKLERMKRGSWGIILLQKFAI